jgi:hypothetical protein
LVEARCPARQRGIPTWLSCKLQVGHPSCVRRVLARDRQQPNRRARALWWWRRKERGCSNLSTRHSFFGCRGLSRRRRSALESRGWLACLVQETCVCAEGQKNACCPLLSSTCRGRGGASAGVVSSDDRVLLSIAHALKNTSQKWGGWRSRD